MRGFWRTGGEQSLHVAGGATRVCTHRLTSRRQHHATSLFTPSPLPPPLPPRCSPTAGKLREALITVLGSAHLPPGLAAVDVGAAPGGWSQQLAAAGARLVVSIDPAELDPAVAALPNLVHLQCKCDQAVSSGRLAAALAAGGCAAIDYLVCDVNAHPGDAYGMLEPVLPLLGPGGVLILTLKTFGRGKHKDGFGAELAAKLAPAGFAPGSLLWLLNNTPCERTYVACKRAAAAVGAGPGPGPAAGAGTEGTAVAAV